MWTTFCLNSLQDVLSAGGGKIMTRTHDQNSTIGYHIKFNCGEKHLFNGRVVVLVFVHFYEQTDSGKNRNVRYKY